MLDQFRRAGLYPRIDPPTMNHPGGTVEPGFQLTLLSSKGDIFYTLDGTDPGSPVNVEELSRTSLISRDAAKRVFIPSSSNGAGNRLTIQTGLPETVESGTTSKPVTCR